MKHTLDVLFPALAFLPVITALSIPLLPMSLSEVLLPGETREFDLNERLCQLPRGLRMQMGGFGWDAVLTPRMQDVLISHEEGQCFGQVLVMERGISVFDVLPVLKVMRRQGSTVELTCVGRSKLHLPLQMDGAITDERIPVCYARYDPVFEPDDVDRSDEDTLTIKRLCDSCISMAAKARPDAFAAAQLTHQSEPVSSVKQMQTVFYSLVALLPPDQRVAALTITDHRRRRAHTFRMLTNLERRLAAEAALRDWDAGRPNSD